MPSSASNLSFVIRPTPFSFVREHDIACISYTDDTMVPAEPPSDASSRRDVDILDIVFSCGVCLKTASEIYATTEGNKGFHSDSGDEDGAVTRLWIGECSHLMCGKHLPGGGMSSR